MKLINTLFSVLFLLTIGLTANAQTNVPALITSDQVWTVSGSPYNITQNTYIDTNVSVTVMPGVSIVSNSENNTLFVVGEFQALGTSDSMITMESLRINLKDPAKSYNSSTGEGFYLNYCEIEGLGSGKRNIEVYRVDFKIENCIFNDPYYGIYGSGSNNMHGIVENCTFNSNSMYGYPLYLAGMSNVIEIRDCEFYNSYGLTLYGDITMENNLVDGSRSVSISSYDDINVSCNHFKNLANSISITSYNYDSTETVIFNNNTIDSSGNTTNGVTMLSVYAAYTGSGFGLFEVNNNNFLYNGPNNVPKLLIRGTNQSPTTYTLLDFQYNYWGSTDSATIASYIKDYSDDITIFGKADFSNYLSGQTSGCYNGTPSCDAYFSFTISGDTVYFEDESSSVNGSHTTSWTFGDGTSGSGSSVSHIYTTTGESYTVCLTITDTATNCDDTYCYTVFVPFNSSCDASFYTAIDTSNPYVIYIVNNSTGTTSNTNYYWTFGDGNGSAQQNPSHQYNNFGLHQICLTLYDTLNNCYSTYCDSVGVDSNGNLLKLEGYRIVVLNESDLLNVTELEVISGLNVYPNPNNGSFKVAINARDKETATISMTNYLGVTVFSQVVDINPGENKIGVSTPELADGLYILNVSTDKQTKSVKLFINR